MNIHLKLCYLSVDSGSNKKKDYRLAQVHYMGILDVPRSISSLPVYPRQGMSSNQGLNHDEGPQKNL